jgi:hypothetical protein
MLDLVFRHCFSEVGKRLGLAGRLLLKPENGADGRTGCIVDGGMEVEGRCPILQPGIGVASIFHSMPAWACAGAVGASCSAAFDGIV